MQGFKNSTKMIPGHNFARTSITVPAHVRAMPVRKGPTMPSVLDNAVPAPMTAKLPWMGVKSSMKTPMANPLANPDSSMPMMANGGLTSADRKGMSKSEFGLPGSRKYPMPDRSHAANAKARASQMVNTGKLSESSKAKIDAKADRILAKAKGGHVFEGSKTDERQDKTLAKKHGMDMKAWEKSSMDAKHDRQRGPKGLARGGDPRVPMIKPKSGC